MNPGAAVPRPGELVAGKYAVEQVLGEGGMGVVVAAMHVQLRQLVALKFMRAEAIANDEAVQRFLREAQATVRLRSQHVGRVIDVGTLASGAPYIVMEHLEGTDLAHHLKLHRRLAVAAAVDLVLEACDALAEAHSLGIVHRDLKPSNLFLARSANGATVLKVLDFGIAKACEGDADVSITATDRVLGSPAYMSPEQMRSSRDVDARTDIWSLGVILHEAVAGARPFDSPGLPELCVKVMVGPTPSLPDDLDLPPGFAAVVARCLDKDRALRYPGIAELAAALAPFGSPASQILAARIAGAAPGKPAGAATVSYPALPAASRTPPTPSPTPTRRWARWTLLALPAIVLTGLAALAWRGGAPSHPADSPVPPASAPAAQAGSPDAGLVAAPALPPDAASAARALPADAGPAQPPVKTRKTRTEPRPAPDSPPAPPAPASQPKWDPIRLPE